MRPKIGVITIGQSPRVDVVPEMLEILGPDVELIEGGALDGLAPHEIAEMGPRDGDYLLITRLQDGTAVQVAKRHIVGRMQAEIDRLEAAGAEAIALLCTGEFPAFRSSRLVVEPQAVLNHFVAGVAGGRRLGAVVPDREQIEHGTLRWRGAAGDLRVEAGSPYADISELEHAITQLRGWGAELRVLDCIGFTCAMKARAAAIAGVPVILPRTVLARTLAELLLPVPAPVAASR